MSKDGMSPSQDNLRGIAEMAPLQLTPELENLQELRDTTDISSKDIPRSVNH